MRHDATARAYSLVCARSIFLDFESEFLFVRGIKAAGNSGRANHEINRNRESVSSHSKSEAGPRELSNCFRRFAFDVQRLRAPGHPQNLDSIAALIAARVQNLADFF